MGQEKDCESDEGATSTRAEQNLELLASQRSPALVWEFYQFLRTNKKWWLGPILIVIAVISFFVMMSLSPAAPFIYTVF